MIRQSLHDLMPGNAELIAMKTIKDLTTIKRNDVLSFGFLLAIFFSSNGMMAMMSGFEKAYKLTFRRYGLFEKRWIALQLTFLLGLLLFCSVILGILGSNIVEFINDFFHLKKFEKFGLTFLRWFLMTSLLYSGVSVIYRLGVPLRKKLPFFNQGAALATILSILASILFSYYVDTFGAYNKVYGSLGTLIVFMLWLQLNIINLLLGFELNAAIAVNRDLKALKETDTGQ
jgi:membrane protein